jgi:hypothetical protein
LNDEHEHRARLEKEFMLHVILLTKWLHDGKTAGKLKKRIQIVNRKWRQFVFRNQFCDSHNKPAQTIEKNNNNVSSNRSIYISQHVRIISKHNDTADRAVRFMQR